MHVRGRLARVVVGGTVDVVTRVLLTSLLLCVVGACACSCVCVCPLVSVANLVSVAALFCVVVVCM